MSAAPRLRRGAGEHDGDVLSDPEILHDADGLVAVAKPAGWLVHPVGTDDPDLGAWLSRDLKPVHRLDKGTSGVVLFAEPARVAHFAEQFASGAVHKTYLALVFKEPRPKGTIRRALRDGRRGKPLEAITRYRTLERFGKCALLEVRPETGRKHQIRRHLQGIGHAIVGDTRYPPRGRPTVPAFPGRLWLHAHRLELEGFTLKAPLPAELSGHLGILRRG